MEEYRENITQAQAEPQTRQPIREDEIRLTSDGISTGYLLYAYRLFEEKKVNSLTLKATGNAIYRAVSLAETIKRKFYGLHQVTKCGSTSVNGGDQADGLAQGKKSVSLLEITLSKDPLDSNDPGYQAPIDQSLVKEITADELQDLRKRTLRLRKRSKEDNGGRRWNEGQRSRGRSRGRMQQQGMDRQGNVDEVEENNAEPATVDAPENGVNNNNDAYDAASRGKSRRSRGSRGGRRQGRGGRGGGYRRGGQRAMDDSQQFRQDGIMHSQQTVEG